MVLRQGMQLVIVGVLVGACAAFVAVRGITSMLHGVKPSDPLTFALIPVVLIGAAAIACFVPARRASGVDPMVALRTE
jgi:putative ABC transport system permease protein